MITDKPANVPSASNEKPTACERAVVGKQRS
jgi:hypothetical protein